MPPDNNQPEQDTLEAKIAKAASDADMAKRRATMALTYAKEARKYSASTLRVGAIIREIEKELGNG